MIVKGGAKGINVLNKQSDPKRTEDVGRRVVQVEACGAAIFNIGSGEEDGQDEEVKPPRLLHVILSCIRDSSSSQSTMFSRSSSGRWVSDPIDVT